MAELSASNMNAPVIKGVSVYVRSIGAPVPTGDGNRRPLPQRADKILVGTRCNAHEAGSLHVPGGKVDPLADGTDEDPRQTASRELKEETGLDYPPDRFAVICVTRDHCLNGKSYETTHLKLIGGYDESKDGPIRTMEPWKCDGWHWVPVTQLTAHLRSGHIPVQPGTGPPLFTPLRAFLEQTAHFVGNRREMAVIEALS